MNCSVGIDLGSTTTKAVVLDESGTILGRGITNSRNNYKTACDVALTEALINARFGLVAGEWREMGASEETLAAGLGELELRFREQQYRTQLDFLHEALVRTAASRSREEGWENGKAAEEIIEQMKTETRALYSEGASRKSDFFRDLAGSRFIQIAEERTQAGKGAFDRIVGLFDKAILEVENRAAGDEGFRDQVRLALEAMDHHPEGLVGAVARAAAYEFKTSGSVGTGYGRRTLPFPKEQIRSEILCHGLGAHALFPGTRTVLDIGGQDTKAIQVDESGIVTSFQMNDRCAAGCGRYLGYIADEMNLGLHELGPLACASQRTVRINSTCTVFAGAELRERLSLGEKREDILAGLHRAIILRAMSLLARSGGVFDEFTFTGGVAKNPAAVGALDKLVAENYGTMTINISPDSIYTGALGAALFAGRAEARPAA